MDQLVIEAPAKVNLGLHILSKRDDGYHEIETGMVAIPWCDRLTFRDSEEMLFTCSDSSLPVDDSNLVVRAARLLGEALGRKPAVKIHLEKFIPHGAGLGGGSSDAAATLKALRSLWNPGFPREELTKLAAALGSDVPFFIDAVPALATGRGERLSTLDVSLSHWIVVLAGVDGISTAEAYGACSPRSEGRADIRELLEHRSPRQWSGVLENDFTAIAVASVPAIRDQCDYLQGSGADFVSLSGSGSAVFGLFETEDAAREAVDGVPFRGVRTWQGRMLTGDAIPSQGS